MQTPSKPAAYLGDQDPSLPDGQSHQAKGNDYVYSPDNYVLEGSANLPQIRIKKVRHLQCDSAAEEGGESVASKPCPLPSGFTNLDAERHPEEITRPAQLDRASALPHRRLHVLMSKKGPSPGAFTETAAD